MVGRVAAKSPPRRRRHFTCAGATEVALTLQSYLSGGDSNNGGNSNNYILLSIQTSISIVQRQHPATLPAPCFQTPCCHQCSQSPYAVGTLLRLKAEYRHRAAVAAMFLNADSHSASAAILAVFTEVALLMVRAAGLLPPGSAAGAICRA